MGKSGFVQLLMLLMAAVIVLLVISSTTGGLPGLWAKLTGQQPTPAQVLTSPKPTARPGPMTTPDGTRHVEQARRDMEVMDSLMQAVDSLAKSANPLR